MKVFRVIGLLLGLSVIPLSGCGGKIPPGGTVLVEEDLHLDHQEGPYTPVDPMPKATPKSRARR